jgi:polyhydroxyalkanoate synthesis regulator protein
MARVIKKYPNRRLYDTETSAYITKTFWYKTREAAKI